MVKSLKIAFVDGDYPGDDVEHAFLGNGVIRVEPFKVTTDKSTLHLAASIGTESNPTLIAVSPVDHKVYEDIWLNIDFKILAAKAADFDKLAALPSPLDLLELGHFLTAAMFVLLTMEILSGIFHGYEDFHKRELDFLFLAWPIVSVACVVKWREFVVSFPERWAALGPLRPRAYELFIATGVSGEKDAMKLKAAGFKLISFRKKESPPPHSHCCSACCYTCDTHDASSDKEKPAYIDKIIHYDNVKDARCDLEALVRTQYHLY